MFLRKLAVACVAAIGLTTVVAVSPAVAGTCTSTTNSYWKLELCAASEMTYIGNGSNVRGHFEVWNHDNTSQSQNSVDKLWTNGDTTGAMAIWPYTCGEFWADQSGGSPARYGPIGCVHRA